MKVRSLSLFFIVFSTAVFAAGQPKSVTNADIEKYRESRLKAEQDYRENYALWGMPAPEELDRRNEKSRKQLEELSAKLRQEELQRSSIEGQRSYQRSESFYYYGSDGYYYPYWDVGILSASWLGPRFRRPHVTPFGLNGYVGGGQFWPTPGSRRPYGTSGYVGGGQFWPSSGSGSGVPIRHVSPAAGARR